MNFLKNFGYFLTCLVVALYAQPLLAQPLQQELISVPLGRTTGLITKKDVEIKAGVIHSYDPTSKALLFFRGWPGIANLQSADNITPSLGFMKRYVRAFVKSKITVVVVDCPSDQLGVQGHDPVPPACDDGYRSSGQHAQDVRLLMDQLKKQYGLNEFYLMGHSMGTISSRHLAINLGDAIAGSIHSAAPNVPPRGPQFNNYGNPDRTVIDLSKVRTPIVHIHHKNDSCYASPYSKVTTYAKGNLITVVGGSPEGEPCSTNFHSYSGHEQLVAQTVARWINFRQMPEVVGE